MKRLLAKAGNGNVCLFFLGWEIPFRYLLALIGISLDFIKIFTSIECDRERVCISTSYLNQKCLYILSISDPFAIEICLEFKSLSVDFFVTLQSIILQLQF